MRLPFLHFNVKSLSRNLIKVEELLNNMSRLSDAIAISETKLNSNSFTYISILKYDFVHNDSTTCTGGVGVFIKDSFQFHLRNDLSLNLPNCEDLRLQIKCKTSDIVLGVIYHHPNKEIVLFQNKIATVEQERLHCIICRDVNINTLGKTNKTLDYINILNSIGCNMAIKHLTRFGKNCKPSLLDHIYISKNNTSCGISAFEI